MLNYGTGVYDIMCDDIHLASVAGMIDITCNNLNRECEIMGLGLII